MITNRYYTTTIIAIFLSLSLGILIGGTLGQQWINDNQQKIIGHYESKAEEMQEKNDQLAAKLKETEKLTEEMKNDFSLLFVNSISHQIENRKVLWINDTGQSFGPLKQSIELAGGAIYEPNEEMKNISETTAAASVEELDFFSYDVVVFFPSEEANLESYKWLLKYKVPVIYVTDNQTEISEKKERVALNIHQQRIDIDSINEHYQFILFLKKLFQEK